MSKLRISLTFILLATISFAQENTTSSGERRALAERRSADYRGVSQHILPSWPGQEALRESADVLRELVQEAVLEALQDSSASSGSIKQTLTELQGDDALEPLVPWAKVPFAELSNVYGSPTLATGFAVRYDVQNVLAYLQFYSQVNGSWELRQSLGGEFDGHIFSMAALSSASPDEVWYVVWGKRIGDSAARMKIRLYGFNGREVRTVWGKDDLPAGRLTVLSADKIQVEYEVKPAPGVPVPPQKVVETWRPSLNGLELVAPPR